MRVAGTVHSCLLGDVIGTSEVPTRHSVGPDGHMSKRLLVR
jgi:hypothetical protein